METCVFPSNPNGTIASWREIRGSLKGIISHKQALWLAGYELVDTELSPTLEPLVITVTEI
jgi:hypothetical protein